MGLPMDLISVDLKEALDSLSEITEISSEDILDHVFGNFVLGNKAISCLNNKFCEF